MHNIMKNNACLYPQGVLIRDMWMQM